MKEPLRITCRASCAALFAGVGIMHFIHPEFFVKIMPDWIPFQNELVYLSGFFEIIGAAGLMFRRTRTAAAFGLILLLIAVFPANINMAMHADRFPSIPAWILFARLPFQFVLVFWVWVCRDN